MQRMGNGGPPDTRLMSNRLGGTFRGGDRLMGG